MFRKKLLAILSSTALLIAVPMAASAQVEDTTTQTSAEAVALQVGDVITISESSAGSGTASATVLAVGGQTVVGESQEGDGSKESEIVSTGETPLGELTIGGHQASVAGDQSSAEANVLEVVFGDESTGTLRVLHSEAERDATSSSSSSDALHASLGDGALVLTVLHAESSADGSSTYLVSINDQQIVTDEDVDGEACPIDANPVLALTLVCAHSENGADVAEANLGEDSLIAQAFSTDSETGDVSTDAEADADTEADVDEDGADAEADVEADLDDSDDPNPTSTTEIPSLPRTGTPLGLISLAGLASLGAGSVMKRRF